jgi:hypothetical protein
MRHSLGRVTKERSVNIRKKALLHAAAVLLYLAPCFPSWTPAAEAAEASAESRTLSEMRKELEQLERRVRELETEKIAREDATRLIIRDALANLGSKINESVSLGGTLEIYYGRTRDFTNRSEGVLGFNAIQLDIEVDANEWTKGSMILEYVDGTNVIFPTTAGFQTSVDRINIDTANITIGDPQRFPPFLTAGRIVLPFGISTGDPVADVLSITSPLTVEVFELRNTAVEIGLGFPTPAPAPAVLPVTPPPVRPLVLSPIFSSWSRALGYKPLPPAPLTPLTPKPAPPPFHVGIFSYDGAAYRGLEKYGGYRPRNHYGATAGFRTRGNCGRTYDQLVGSAFCPWSIDVSAGYISSIFDSQFLAFEYEKYLGQIGFVDGMFASVKSTLGPVSLVAEWNGATKRTRFIDDRGKRVHMNPSAWQIALGYQFDWNPWVEAIGAQGDYLTIGYSQSHDLAGANQAVDLVSPPTRVGFVPRKRFTVGAGEWVLSNLKFAIEYVYNADYPRHKGGTGNSADAYFSQFTLVW